MEGKEQNNIMVYLNTILMTLSNYVCKLQTCQYYVRAKRHYVLVQLTLDVQYGSSMFCHAPNGTNATAFNQ
jgi:hypothetical protein